MNLDPWSCLSFDVGCVEFDERFTIEMERTKEVDMTPEEIRKRDDRKATKLEPANSHAVLMQLLGVPTDEIDVAAPFDQMQHAAAWFRQQAGWPSE